MSAFDVEAHQVAQAVAEEFVGWTRIKKGQVWLGMSHAQPVQIGPRFTIDEDTGQPIVYGTARAVVEDRDPRQAVDAADFQAFVGLLDDSRPELPLAEAIIADGLHLVTLSKPNPSQAVLLAAIGSEVKAKRVLRAQADATQLPLVEFILTKPREVTLQAIGLFDDVMELVNGRSLKSENKATYLALDRLFQLRNAVAHRGQQVSLDDARPAVFAAIDASRWLDAI